MALIQCPDCRTEVSDSAAACPKCARPISGRLPAATAPALAPAAAVAPVPLAKRQFGAGYFLLVLLICGVAFVFAAEKAGLHLPFLSNVKEELAKETGIKTEKAAGDDVVAVERQRGSEANAAVGAANDALSRYHAIFEKSDSPGAETLVAAQKAVLNAVRVAKDRVETYKSFIDANLGVLQQRGLTVQMRDALVKNIATLATTEASVAKAKFELTFCFGNRDWQGAGVSVEAGDQVTIWATGQWSPGSTWKKCGPDGSSESGTFDYRIIKGNAKVMCLVARIAGHNEGYTVGSFGRFAAPRSGTVELRPNVTPLPSEGLSLNVLVAVQPR